MAAPRFQATRRDDAHATGPAAPSIPIPGPTHRRLLPDAAGPRMRVLSILSSGNQMYSGVGRAVFELTSRLAERVAYEFVIDDYEPRNVRLVLEFGARHGIPVHVGPALLTPRSMDTFSASLPGLLRRDDWDAVEAISWANAGTNDVVLREVADRPLIYTPHYQPSWTVPMPPDVADHTDCIHCRMAVRADAVLCVSPWERRLVQGQAPGRNNCHFVANGCDPAEYRPRGGERHEQLLFVGDLAEPRKRFDRILAILPGLLDRRPDLKLVVIGNGSTAAEARIPEALRHAVELRGYVPEADLRRAYAESRGVFLLSDFEAFGIPILEGLVSGAPAFVTDLEVTRSLFEGYHGVKFCPGDDPETTLAIVIDALDRGDDETRAVLDDRDRLVARFDWDTLALRKWELMAAAWFTRHYVARPFRGPRPLPRRALG